MGFTDLLRAPWNAAQTVVRAADDLHAVAERARRDPDPIEEVQILLESLLIGGRDLRLTGDSLDAHTIELISGGRELTETAKEISAHLVAIRAALPRLLEGLDTVDDLETSVGTVADTMEPLQGVADRVGRVTRRLAG